MKAAPRSHVDFSLLTSELRILPIAPSWAEVERAMERLEGALSDDELADSFEEQTAKDLQTVRDFHQNLEDHRETLALALYCAMLVGSAAPSGTPGERLAAGLRAISKCYQFEQLTGDERLREVQRLSRELKAELGPPASLDATAWKTWWESVQKAAGELAEDESWAESSAWDQWFTRLEEYISKGTLAFRPNLDDVLGALQTNGPNRFFRFDLSEMSLADWSDAFYHASTEFVRADFIFPTLLQLGGPLIGKRPAPIRGGWTIENHREISATHWTILVRRQRDSMANKWFPASDHGLVALDLFQIGNDPWVVEELAPKLIVIELTVDEEGAAIWDVATKYPDQAATSIADKIQSLAPNDSKIAYLVPDNLTTKVPILEGSPLIFGVEDADDMLLQGQSLTGIDLTKKADSEPVKSSKPRKGKTKKEDG